MAMMLNHRNIMGANAAAVRRLARQEEAREDVSSVLLVVGFVTCLTVVLAASSLSPASQGLLADPIDLGALLVAFVGGLGTMWAALWVADDAARRRATGRIILGVSMAPTAVAFALGLSSATTTTPTASTSFEL